MTKHGRLPLAGYDPVICSSLLSSPVFDFVVHRTGMSLPLFGSMRVGGSLTAHALSVPSAFHEVTLTLTQYPPWGQSIRVGIVARQPDVQRCFRDVDIPGGEHYEYLGWPFSPSRHHDPFLFFIILSF
jgi:hypothetical protein